MGGEQMSEAMSISKKKAKIVSVIPATEQQILEATIETNKIRVAAYCRVSTEMEEQRTSYQAQIEHYAREIALNPQWELAGIYADEGISGTNTKKRTEFNRMINDCMKGKIDMVRDYPEKELLTKRQSPIIYDKI